MIMLKNSTFPKSAVLSEVFDKGIVVHPDGSELKAVANVSFENCRALHEFVLAEKPRTVIEIGMAYGVSTLSILTALEENGNGKLISIDPYPGWPTGAKVACNQVERAGLSGRHQHIYKPSYTALPAILDEGEVKPDLIYIDGKHNFDYAFTDFMFSDKLVPDGGTIVFNDAGWPAVHKAIRFVERHRRYEELPVMPKTYKGRNLLFSLAARFQGRCRNDRYFRKLETWEPDDLFFKNF